MPGPGLCWASQQVTSDGELYSYSLHITKLLRTRGEALGGNYKAQSTHRDSANDQAASAIISENVKCPHKINLQSMIKQLQFQSQVPSDPPID